jgi:cell division control protein 6
MVDMDKNFTNDVLDEVFNKVILGKSLYKNKNALRSDYIPTNLPFREKQITTVGEILAPLLYKSKCSNLFIYGKPGTGKTAVSKYVIKRLEKKAISQKNKIDIGFAYSNARVSGTEYRLLSDFAKYLNILIPFTGLALNEVFKRISDKISKNDLSTIFIIDEVDFLIKNYGDNLLYELTRSSEQLEKGFISIIGISNDLQFKEFLDPRVLSSLNEEEIVFPPYTVEELKHILQERSNIAFENNAISIGAINLCAALAGSEHGDARRALELLRISGEVAEREGNKQVSEKNVRIAVQKIEQDRIIETLTTLPIQEKILLARETLTTLPIQEKILLASILSLGKSESTGELYNSYSNICNKCGIEILTQRRISMLLNELDLLGIIATNIISKGRYGRTKKISILIQPQLIREIFFEDPVLKSII